jgi:hypothetical protein
MSFVFGEIRDNYIESHNNMLNFYLKKKSCLLLTLCISYNYQNIEQRMKLRTVQYDVVST